MFLKSVEFISFTDTVYSIHTEEEEKEGYENTSTFYTLHNNNKKILNYKLYIRNKDKKKYNGEYQYIFSNINTLAIECDKINNIIHFKN